MIDIIVENKNIMIKSEYNQNLVAFMRSRPVRHWDKINKVWSLPSSDLKVLLEFVNGSEYNINFIDNKDSCDYKGVPEFEFEDIPEWYSFKTKPYGFQSDGIRYGLKHHKFLLADEQGLGKSFQVLNIAQIRKESNKFKHVLIIPCINGLKYNWQKEIEEHTNEKGFILGTRSKRNSLCGTCIAGNEERLRDIENIGVNGYLDDYYYLITNIETLRYSLTVDVPIKTKKGQSQKYKKQTVFPIVEAIQKQIDSGNISMIVCDEFHKVKNSNSQIGKALLSLDCDYKIALTGTPVMNNPVDLYSILYWIGMEDHSSFAFKKHYCIFGGFGNHQIVGYKNLPELQSVLDRCMLRRLKSDVLDLPDKIRINDYVEMSKEQEGLYNEVLSSLIKDIDKIKLSPNPLTMLIRLRQVTGNPDILSTKSVKNPKFERMLELISDVIKSDRKCIVFSNWTNVIEPAYTLTKSNGIDCAIYTGNNTAVRESEKERFKKDSKCKVLFGTIGAMGTGLTLTEATTAIFLDEPWSRAIKDQCEDRVHRIGTSESPNIITIMCKGTIDERINNIVYRKGKLSDIVVDKEEDIISNPKLIDYLLNID